MLEISPENVCYVILKARAFDVQEEVVEEDPGSNEADEGFPGVLAAHADNPAYNELKAFIEDLSDDEQVELVALAWIGRGDFEADELLQAKAEARDRHTGPTADYLLGIPLVADYMEAAFNDLGYSCADYEA